MYIPASFRETDAAKLHGFIEQHSFATLVSQHEGEPFASHLPLLLDPDSGSHGQLIGHMARANPQWQTAAGQRVLAIFHGPHTYVSPGWYETANVVPTWNYVTVHAYGTLRLIEDRDRLQGVIQRMVGVYESSMPQPWSLESTEPEFLDRMLGAIIGFEIPIDRLEGKWKLNQNHPAQRREKVIRRLSESGGPDEQQIAELMRHMLG